MYTLTRTRVWNSTTVSDPENRDRYAPIMPQSRSSCTLLFAYYMRYKSNASNHEIIASLIISRSSSPPKTRRRYSNSNGVSSSQRYTFAKYDLHSGDAAMAGRADCSLLPPRRCVPSHDGETNIYICIYVTTCT